LAPQLCVFGATWCIAPGCIKNVYRCNGLIFSCLKQGFLFWCNGAGRTKCYVQIENLNAEYIKSGVNANERLALLNERAIEQLDLLMRYEAGKKFIEGIWHSFC
jgi:hypothetical protein